MDTALKVRISSFLISILGRLLNSELVLVFMSGEKNSKSLNETV